MKTRVLILLWFLSPIAVWSQISGQMDRTALESELARRNISMSELSDSLNAAGLSLEELEARPLSKEERVRVQAILRNIEGKKDTLVPETKAVVKEQKAPGDTLPEKVKIELDTSTKIKYEIYGQELFRNGIIRPVSESNRIKAPESYVLGQGDQIIISIWGRSQFENSYTIAEDGFIRILNGRLRVYLKGLSLSTAREKLRRILSSEYSFTEGEFDVAVNYARTVRISIVGEVYENPGSYTVSGFNNVLNALSLVKGPGDIGSLRNIKLQKADGRTVNVDVYSFMKNPAVATDYYLEDNDIILVPVIEKLVSVKGAIRRPLNYELKQDEGLSELIDFAGGLGDKAYLKKLQIRRYRDNVQRIIDVDWESYRRQGKNFSLENGDEVFIESIDRTYRNYVSISGELEKPGRYERTDGMRISDIVHKAGLTPLSSTELIYLQRQNANGTTRLVRLDLQEILDAPSVAENLLLQDRDSLEVWSQERFADKASVKVSGAVRIEGQYPYDQDGEMRVSDAILMAGGLRRDASSFATVHYNDPLNDKMKYYKTIDDIHELVKDRNHPSNFVLQAFDSLVVQSLNEIGEKYYVRIDGAVNRPGEFQYGEDMTLKDLIILAGGFQIDAATDNIEISRVIIENNAPTKIVVANIEMNRNFELLNDGNTKGEYRLQPYDNVAVRFIKDFDLQDRVFVSGEVEVPGPYALNKDDLRISSIIRRAGGLTDEAFPEGATLTRKEQDLGPIVIKLDDILANPSSAFNLILKDGDRISIPKIREFVTIRGATRVTEVVLDRNIGSDNLIRVPYFKGKDAAFYIHEFCGGFDDMADRQKVFVEYPNGEIKYTKPGLFRRNYPDVKQGSVITVGYKDVELPEENEAPPTDWTKVLSDSVGQALSILTLILLVQRID